MMRLLVTGATGFLGRHVLASPSFAGCTLLRATRSTTASSDTEVPLGPGPWSRGDFARAIEAARPDVILHLAGATGAMGARTCFDANAILAAELLAAAAALPRAPGIVLVGSAAEYGFVEQSAQPVREDHPCAPVTDYGIAKYAQTLLGLRASAQGGRVLVARLFNPVGEGMPSHLALSSFARQLALPTGSAPVLRVGNLDVRRDFLDVREAARLLAALALRPTWPWPLVNLCSGRAYRLQDLLNNLITASGLAARIEVDPSLLRPGEMPELAGDTTRLRQVGLLPETPDFGQLLPKLLAEARRQAGLGHG
ncbi:NAD-dependent epimerase/dehydratase family protein [Plastoroseomonas hellenica]|uniref:NAD-dependent epimerase/dehydratase family protein n=1 Tax=Plastoroseomonas hellenica TaxID=2687306 RepID=UPI001BAB4D2B|nr:NAD-dependent epimerase/dehydratase family protein [Plastoroseomonas hellenica]MBR0641454.1 NAD-dependent epimerase/dehydratase family protein [Plastoroseomonas hellenica]